MQQNAPPVHTPALFNVTPKRVAILTGYFVIFGLGGYAKEAGFSIWRDKPPTKDESPATAIDRKLDKIARDIASWRDCDSSCVDGLRSSASKTEALEDTLTSINKEKTALESRYVELENSYRSDTGLWAKRLGDSQQELAETKAFYEKRIASLQIEDSGKIPVARPTAERRIAKADPKPVSPKKDSDSGERAGSKSKDWRLIGMTATTAVISASGKVVALGAGESYEGVTVENIDLDKGVARTSAGDFSLKH